MKIWTRKGAFAWLSDWQMAKLYFSFKTRNTESDPDTYCRLYGKAAESLPHVLSGCHALAQNKYLARHNAVLQVLLFEMLRELRLVASTPPWYSPVAAKSSYKSPKSQAFGDIPLFAAAENNHVQQNRVDARFINHKANVVLAVQMSCPWIDNRSRKKEKKTITSQRFLATRKDLWIPLR